MANELVVIGQQESTALALGGLGLEGFKIKPSVMKLVQRTSTFEGAIPGKLFDTLSGQYFDTVQAVPLAIKVGRVLFPPGGDLGAEPLCRSDNGIVPSPNATVPQSPKCETCDHGPKLWKTWRSTGVKPDCQEKYTLLFVLRESGLPYYLTVGGASISNLNKLKTLIYRDVLVSKAKGQSRNLFDYTFEIKPVAIQGKKGSYYVISFVNTRVVENPGEFGPVYEEFVLRQRLNDAEISDQDTIEGELVDTVSARGASSDSYASEAI